MMIWMRQNSLYSVLLEDNSIIMTGWYDGFDYFGGVYLL